MSQHDQVIANASAAAVRADINNALGAIFSNSSGATAPSTTVAYQFWADTTANVMKMRNSANSGWINLYTIDGTTQYLGDANYFSSIVSSNARLTFDTNDYIEYTRASNAWDFRVGGTSYATIDANGIFSSNIRIGNTGYGYAMNADATSSYLSFAANDYFVFNRSTNVLSFLVGGAQFFSLVDGFGSIDSAGGAGGRLKSSNGANSMRLGFASPYPTIAVDNTVYQVASPSDVKLKKNVNDLDLDTAWQNVKSIRWVEFDWINGPIGRQPGVIAQEVETVNPAFVLPTMPSDAPEEQIKQLNLPAIVATLGAALQQAMARIEALESTAE